MTIDVDALRTRLAAALGDSLQLGDTLGVGGFAAVFRARDPRLERDVAIKVLDPALGVSAELEEQFLREARIVADVEHPHIVPLYSAESRDGLLYLVMRLLSGRTLADRIAREGALEPAEAARIAHEVAEALALAHERGVIHRDIKPDNILLDAAGNATVTDFGVSLVTRRAEATVQGTTVGTPTYMSPEQAMGEALSGHSDVYSLGVVLFEMLAGRVPFVGRSVQELIAMHVAAPPPRVSELRPETPAALAELVDRMLAKDPAARPSSADAVRALAAARAPDALLSPAAVRRRKRRKRLIYFSTIGATAAVVVVVGVVLAVRAAVGVTVAMSSGEPPALDATGAGIPDSVIQRFVVTGGLRPDETPTYAFIPAGKGLDAAMVMTDSVLVHGLPAAPRRIPLEDARMDLNFHKDRRAPSAVGLFIVSAPGLSPDTVYRDLGGLEFSRLRTSIMSLARLRERDR
ncbi:MAG TPA: serine/threonine-protein kinase [Gemmatimonadaceae bacterium]|nr:serine/threonine-protein kinase [Gemmatimonadaceae bacterium]